MPVTGPHCDGCPNQDVGIVRVLPDGLGTNGVMLVGDSPWKQEVVALKPFAGAAGYYLGRTLSRQRLQREHFSIANAMWCKPPHLGWTDEPERYPDAMRSIEQCSAYLDEFIALRKPRCFVALGNVALRRLTGFTGIESNHSYVIPTSYGIPAVPSFHPSHIMQGKQRLTSVLAFGLSRALEIAGGTYQESKYELLLDPPIEKAQAYLNRVSGRIPMLFVDIETPESAKLDEEDRAESGLSYNIIRASFSHTDGTAITFPWTPPYIELMMNALKRADVIAEWTDDRFDTKRLRAAGASWTGKVMSGMWAWHFCQSDLLKGLAFVAPFFYAGPPFKHLGSTKPDFYNAMDSAVGRACTVGSIKVLKDRGAWDRFQRHCVDLTPILAHGGGKGVRIDRGSRESFFDALKIDLAKARGELQHSIPSNLFKWKEWVRPPKDMTEVETYEVPATHKDGSIVLTEAGQRLMKPAWRRKLSFNENSPIQVKGLIRHCGLKVPVVRGDNGEDRETAERKHLLRFSKKFSIFKLILFAKQRGKLISTYQWPLDQYNRVYTTFGFHPSTWRKSSRGPNMMNIPKRSDLAQAFRKMIVASPGCKLVEFDSSAIEAVLVGYDAGSERYIRLAKAGIHGWMTYAYHGQVIPIDLPFDELKRRCKEAKNEWKNDYEVLKRVDHLTNYLGTPGRIFEEYPEEFESEAQAAKMQRFYYSTEAGQDVRRWQQRQCARADRETYLDNHFNYRHYFYEVSKWDSRRKCNIPGDDAKRAVAFVPQSDASAIQTEVLLKLVEESAKWIGATTKQAWEMIIADRWKELEMTPIGLIRLIIHDSLVSDVPDKLVDRICWVKYQTMTMPIRELGGLGIGVEGKVGDNLGDWNPETNPGGMREWMPSR